MKFVVLSLSFLLFCGAVFAQNWQQIKTVDDVCKAYPEAMEKMLGQFNVEYPGMENVKKARDSGNLTKACTQLLNYYRHCGNAGHLRNVLPDESNRTDAEADTILKNVFVIQNVRGEVPFLEDGHRDWYYKGPNNDREWAWLSNRHSQISYVLSTYLKTGNPKYAAYIDLFLRDFIIKSMPYPEKKSSTSVWRGLEVSFRGKVWSQIFYGLMDSKYLLPATRLLMLSSLPDHAHYNRNFHGENNWLTMEISALATVATNFPEYKDAPEWLDYSVGTMVESMKGQIYPDGVQTELTLHYHIVALANFELFKNICENANRTLPDYYLETLEKMQNYLAYTMRPNGTGILNNDGDLDDNRQRILDAAKSYVRPDWEFIASNGKNGETPANRPSFFSPWAGHLISRSGFDADAHWSFFDIGPWGSGHQHNDKLHISVAAYGRDLLVDAGRFAYTGEVAEKFRNYVRGSAGHNVLLIDGKGQGPGPRLAEQPVPEKHWRVTDAYDYAWSSFGEFAGVEGVCEHTRRLFYARGDLWVVVDQIKTDRPRKIDALWHWHPDCDVQINGSKVVTKNETGNLQIVPVGSQKWKLNLVKGQEEPEIQGWYSREYNKYEPNVASVYSTKIEGDDEFVWVLFPSKNVADDVKAEIVSKTDDEIRLRVFNSKNDEWFVTIPL
ncbi:Heparinase II/III-like protein [Mariniphaga anaerophila]|uniref:Heparinase II/III-like protein n=1 Tax=Mariniphaga anaerophila TaxID=1484053 RepID=A0A1M4W1M0_9BACT|nr:alginate lyase family protein [Mariniphaga anaerophila]SHE75119.1 Heparinase II/III-like protein [Mariniphaga anaerophila]